MKKVRQYTAEEVVDLMLSGVELKLEPRENVYTIYGVIFDSYGEFAIELRDQDGETTKFSNYWLCKNATVNGEAFGVAEEVADLDEAEEGPAGYRPFNEKEILEVVSETRMVEIGDTLACVTGLRQIGGELWVVCHVDKDEETIDSIEWLFKNARFQGGLPFGVKLECVDAPKYRPYTIEELMPMAEIGLKLSIEQEVRQVVGFEYKESEWRVKTAVREGYMYDTPERLLSFAKHIHGAPFGVRI